MPNSTCDNPQTTPPCPSRALAKTSAEDRGTVEVDTFRFDRHGRIVEHWDALQPVAEKSANGNPQV
ncbi:hypothetical protein [Streptomyces scabiei]|uniref:hypothetical protein n=1 Tax=Streptomyces scabiei TaxID=1930 RepID=UPI0029A173E1|nr:hypothetical protein [Streptomyces scabiei]MDX3522699.1 hypothetical protein [Streptomyces scabiei]